MTIFDAIRAKLNIKCAKLYLNVLEPFFKKYKLNKLNNAWREWLIQQIVWADESYKNIVV